MNCLIELIGEPIHISKYESDVPLQVTEKILEDNEIPSYIPRMPSSVVEDFIVEKIKEGVTDIDVIIQNYKDEKISEKITDNIKKAEKLAHVYKVDSLLSSQDISNIKQCLKERMELLKLPNNKIEDILSSNITFILKNDCSYTRVTA